MIGWWPYSYDPSVASVRIRCLHPLAALQRAGYPIELYDPRNAGRYRVVLFSKHFSQQSLEAAQALKRNGTRIIYDLCDNYFSNPEEQEKRQEKMGRLSQFLDLADRVVVSTDALAEVVAAQMKLTQPVTVVGDAVEPRANVVRLSLWRSWFGAAKVWYWAQRLRSQRRQGRHALVWFGNRGSSFAGGIRDLATIRDALEAVNRDYPLTLTVISNSRRGYKETVEGWSVPTRYIAWDLVSAPGIIAAHDVAVIPIVANPITVCKTNNRLAAALHLGVAVVADPIPSYEAFSGACILGDWEAGLRRYLADSSLRQRHVAEGRAIIERDWKIERIAEQWKALFDAALQD
ncbi:hypothetical protein [Pelagibius marinus]|uniref:hypothetical protein n=1 Tax=Pelagibius marinus TaxID=2762760 RepID=UPI0018729391|nr:hypothetical protein [Pelagibius marinus]